MFKLVALFALLACATAAPGYLAAPALHAPVVAAPAVAVAHSVPLATSYANTYKVSLKSPLVAPVAYTAPVAYAAPVVKAAPVVAAHPVVAHAPFAYAAHAPVVALH
ncbi:cuticle protein 12.5-like [Linepithema humile]|uniref:cuticle protein 12.5-like n=1 Tax=Linepithema humile TaxID=83485 RepID=UPI0006234447|nr:PREDICTED: cuticle protein 12.5-like [Linepithema humile]